MDAGEASCLKIKRSGSAPILGRSVWPSSIGQVPAYGQKVRQRAGRRSTGHGLVFRPNQMTPTQDQHHIRAMSVPCMLSTSSISEESVSEKREENLSHIALAEDKPIRSRGWCRGIMRWTRRVGNAIRTLCCCIPSRKTPRLGQRRVSPQKWGTERNSRDTAAGRAQVPLCFDPPSLLCGGPSSVSSFHFPRPILTFLPSLSTLQFFLNPKPSPSSEFLLFPAGSQYEWFLPHWTQLSFWPHLFPWTPCSWKKLAPTGWGLEGYWFMDSLRRYWP